MNDREQQQKVVILAAGGDVISRGNAKFWLLVQKVAKNYNQIVSTYRIKTFEASKAKSEAWFQSVPFVVYKDRVSTSDEIRKLTKFRNNLNKPKQLQNFANTQLWNEFRYIHLYCLKRPKKKLPPALSAPHPFPLMVQQHEPLETRHSLPKMQMVLMKFKRPGNSHFLYSPASQTGYKK